MHPDTSAPPARHTTLPIREQGRSSGPTTPVTGGAPPGVALTGAGLSVFAARDAATHRQLYGDPSRLTRRTRALRSAKTVGADAAMTLADLAAGVTAPGARIADIGCGRGTSSLYLSARLKPAHLTLIDRSVALLHTASERVRQCGDAPTVAAVCADFHHLPLQPGSLDLAVAAFCLYHSTTPHQVLAQIAAALVGPGDGRAGHAVLATKSTTSYVELDELMATIGFDPDAVTRPSLYATFHSTNITDITATVLDIVDLRHERHVFRFTSHDHLAAYLSTTPKYPLPATLSSDPDALARELAHRGAPTELTMTSTVTYLLARARP